MCKDDREFIPNSRIVFGPFVQQKPLLTEDEIQADPLYALLPEGKEDAKKAEDIAKILDTSKATCNAHVKELRDRGVLIGSSKGTWDEEGDGGLFLPASEEESKACLIKKHRELKNRVCQFVIQKNAHENTYGHEIEFD